MVTESPKPRFREPFVPEGFWEHYLKPILVVRPNGVTVNQVNRLFIQEHGYPMDPKMYGYGSIKELLTDIQELSVSCGKVFYDWGYWSEEFPNHETTDY